MGSPTMLGRYRLGERLGRGGLGEVFAAETDGPDGFRKRVVVKRIRAALIEDAEVLRRFVDEAKLVAGLSHGNIVQVLDFAEDGGERFIVMEFVDGCSVDALLSSPSAPKEGLGIGEVLYIVESVCAALHYAHAGHGGPDSAPLVHRDVAPGNVLLSKTGVVKLADFGIAASAGVRDASGTPAFAAPEQLAGEPVDVRADVYGVGQLLKFMLPRVHEAEWTKFGDAQELLDVARKASATDVTDRFTDVELVRRELERWRAGHGIPHAPGRLARWVGQVSATRQLARMQLASEIAASRWTVTPKTALLGAAGHVSRSSGSRARLALTASIGALALVGLVTLGWMSPWAPSAQTNDASESRPAEPTEGDLPLSLRDGSLDSGSSAPLGRRVAEQAEQDTNRVDRNTAQSLVSADDLVSPPQGPTSGGSGGASLGEADTDTDAGGSERELDKNPGKGSAKKGGPKPGKADPSAATLRINLLPYALVELDGKEIGKTPLTRSVTVGSHSVTLRNPETGKERTLTFTLENGATHEVIDW